MGIFFGIFGMGGWEMVLLLALVLILFVARRLPNIAQGLSEGLSQFRKESDRAAHDAGESLGGIYGKPAAEALTPDNQTAELYDPAVLSGEERGRPERTWKRFSQWSRWWPRMWHSVFKRLKEI
jgi:sec-independent protein translocase protein TatA